MGSDGGDLIPTWIDYLIINPGETYDVMVFGNNTLENYWIRLETTEVFDFFYVRKKLFWRLMTKRDIHKPKYDFIEKISMFKMFACTLSSSLVLEYNSNSCEFINIST